MRDGEIAYFGRGPPEGVDEPAISGPPALNEEVVRTRNDEAPGAVEQEAVDCGEVAEGATEAAKVAGQAYPVGALR